MKSWVKSLLIGLSITLISLSALIGFLPSLLKPTLNRWLPDILQTAGIDNGVIKISTFSWQQLHIQQLQMPLPDGSLFSLKEVDLRFAPGELITGQLKSLSIKQMTLSLAGESGKKLAGAAAAGAKHAANEALEENPLIEIPAFKQWLSLPLQSLKIYQINLQHPAIAATLQAEVNPELWRIWGEAKLDNIPLPWQLEMQLQSSGNLLVLLSESQQLLAQIHANIEQNNQGETHINLTNSLNLQAFSQRLLLDISDQLPVTDAQVTAQIKLPASFQLPQGVTIASQIQLNTEEALLLANKDSGQQLRWLGGQTELLLNKPQGEALQLTLHNHQQLLLQIKDADYHISQHSDKPLITGQCDSAFEHCTLGGLLPWYVQGHNQQLSLSLSPNILWSAAEGSSGTLMLNLKAHQSEASLPQGRLISSGEFQFRSDTSGNWRLLSESGVTNILNLKPIAFTDTHTNNKTSNQQITPSDIKLTLLKDLLIENTQGDWRFNPLAAEVAPLSIKVIQQTQRRQTDVATLNIGESYIRCLPQISANQQTINAQCDLSLTGLPSQFQQWPVPDFSIQGPTDFSLGTNEDHPIVHAAGALTFAAANDQVQLRSQIQHQQQGDTQQGSLQWHMNDVPLNWDVLNLSEMTTLTQMQLLDGALSGQGWLDWSREAGQALQIKPDVMLRIDDVSATYDNSLSLEKWRALFAMRRPIDFATGLPGDFVIDAQLAGDSLNSGVKLSNILARSQTRVPADFSSAIVEVYEMHTDILGGRVHTPLIRFDTQKDINAFGIEVENIQLSELAKLEPNADVEATGTLDGVLPIVLTPDGPQVPGGTLFARQPGGIIRYNNATSQALKASDQTVGLALQLLENFNYSQLESGVEYQPDGTLNLALQFQGHNPEFFDGQATHLNVNLDYNLLDLLESLRITNDLIQKVEDKYQL